MTYELFVIFVYLLFSLFLSAAIVFIAMLLVNRTGDIEKISAYECGFHPFEDSRSTFDVRFYLVAILFIVFDLEVTFLFPWSITLNYSNFFGFFVMLIFLIVLILGFIYEWINGALDWD